MVDTADELQVRRYFLGELPGEEAEHLERLCFDDSALADAISLIEDDLVDEYVRNELTAEQNARFDQYYLTTDARRSRIEVARAFNRGLVSVPEVPTQKEAPTSSALQRRFLATIFNWQPMLGYALAAAFVIAVIAGLWFVFRTPNRDLITEKMPESSPGESAPRITESAGPVAPTPVAESTPKPQGSEQGSTVPRSQLATTIFTLHAGGVRDVGVGEQVLTLSPQTETVELQFVLQDPVSSLYDIRLETAEGEFVMGRRSVKPVSIGKQKILVVRGRASALAARDYVGRVVDPDGNAAASYVFRVAEGK